jgi:RNA polymerase sigma-70 factor (ECF subfamily)
MQSFDEVVLPHLGAAHQLARWMMGNEHDAEDVVQEASLRALRYFRTFAGGNGRAWFLRIVRNTSQKSWGRRARTPTDTFDEERHSTMQSMHDPETFMLHTDNARLIDEAMKSLPVRSRELLVLREMEGLSYRELADVMDIPVGTVMSSLSRARRAFRGALDRQINASHAPGSRLRVKDTSETPSRVFVDTTCPT